MKSSLNLCREYGEEAGLTELGFIFSSQGLNDYVFFAEYNEKTELIVLWLHMDMDGKPYMRAIVASHSREWFRFGSTSDLKMEVLQYLSRRKFAPAIKALRKNKINTLLT